MSLLRFERADHLNPGRKTSTWLVLGPAGHPIGRIEWYAPWRRYVLAPEDSLWDSACLAETQVFIDGRMAERRR